jgi:hypothetical protein
MVDARVERLVRLRAGRRCEYCHQPEVAPLWFTVDHVIARKHTGSDEPSNLALACALCNLNKGSDLTSLDPLTGEVVRLFDPRRNRWAEHFDWVGLRIVGRTPTGRATVAILDLNDEDRLSMREISPPVKDPPAHRPR